MYEFYYRFLLIKATWDIASAAIGLEPIGHNISNKYLYRCWAVEWAMWAVGWLRDGLRLWPWAGLRGGLPVGSVAVDRGVGRAALRPTQPMGGPLPTPQPAHKICYTYK